MYYNYEELRTKLEEGFKFYSEGSVVYSYGATNSNPENELVINFKKDDGSQLFVKCAEHHISEIKQLLEKYGQEVEL